MEFSLGRSDRFYLIHQDQEEEKQQQQQQQLHMLEFSKRPSPFTVPAVASSSSSSTGFGWEHDGRGEGGGDGCNLVEKEHMFDKVVTPSDVGKLNRLVIPKHHAEKHFPLDASANEKGLLLSFEDRAGKAWRFRYSYWNSSQSYVMTKGWSRFVKEKGLSAGDTVFFGRGVGEAARHRLFIDWKRRRPETTTTRDARFTIPLPGPWSSRILLPPPPAVACGYNWQGRAAGFGATAFHATAAVGGGQLLYYKLPAARPPEMVGVQQLGSHGIPMVRNSVPQVEQNQAAVVAKRVRLFGVNLDSPESGSRDAGLFHPRTTAPLPPLLHQQQAAAGSSSSSSSSSASKEQQQHSPLDLYL